MWGRREPGRQHRQPLGIEAVHDLAHGLVVAAQVLGNRRALLAAGGGQQDLAPT